MLKTLIVNFISDVRVAELGGVGVENGGDAYTVRNGGARVPPSPRTAPVAHRLLVLPRT